jgi:microcystin-dependent protein
MSQYDFSTINPTTTTGTALAAIIGSFRTALATTHSGTARPSYIQTGQTWLDTAAAQWLMKSYDGAADLLLGTVDPTTHKWIPDLTNHRPETTVASATTTDIMATTTEHVIISGTTAISSFGTRANAVKYVRFSGSLTITNGANIVTGSGSNLAVVAGQTIIVVTDNAGVAYVFAAPVSAGDPSQVAWFARSTPPTGWLKCNGAAISRTTYAALYTQVGTTYGVGDGSTTFNVPDLRGEFIRGWDDARGVDASRVFGSLQAHLFASHNHGVSDPTHAHSVYDPGHAHNYTRYLVDGNRNGSLDGNPGYGKDITAGTAAAGTGIGIYGAGTGISIAAAGGAETRPRNVALLACIRY